MSKVRWYRRGSAIVSVDTCPGCGGAVLTKYETVDKVDLVFVSVEDASKSLERLGFREVELSEKAEAEDESAKAGAPVSS